tara:strand:+ start:198 stop:392 length:195 start_codon:yes stop_codon:yes gene_type:complete
MISHASRRAIRESYIALRSLGYEYQCRKVLYSRRGLVVDVYCPCCEYVEEGSTDQLLSQDFGEK